MRSLIEPRNRHSRHLLVGHSHVSLLAAGAAVAADIRVFSSGAPANVERVLARTFTHDIGDRVEFTVANPADIQEN